MKPSLLQIASLTLAALGALGGSVSAEAAPIVWEHDRLDEGLLAAAESNALVLVDVYTTWCGPCRRLDEEVFVTDAVAEAAEGMVTVKVNAEQGVGPQLVREYHVVGYPTVLVLDAQGQELERVFGFQGPEEFARSLRRIRYGQLSFGELFSDFAAPGAGGRVVPSAYERGFHAATRGDYETADTLLRGVVAADPTNVSGYASRAMFALAKYRFLRGAQAYDQAIRELTALRARYPESPEAAWVPAQIGIAHARAGRAGDAVAAFRAMVQADPADADAVNAVAFTMYLEGIGLADAATWAETALEQVPDNHALWDTLAEIRFAQGDAAGAIEAIDQAIVAAPDYAYYAEQRARFEEGGE